MQSSPVDDGRTDDSDTDPWEQLAEYRDTLEMCVEEETPFADYAEQLLNRLAEEEY